jgi:hypothetical protein
MFHGMPEIENFAAPDKPFGAVPDPLGPIADDDHRRIGSEPTQLPQLPVQPVEDVIGIAQTTHQKPPHHRAASGRSLDSLFGQQ